jgi:hypothetical protein
MSGVAFHGNSPVFSVTFQLEYLYLCTFAVTTRDFSRQMNNKIAVKTSLNIPVSQQSDDRSQGILQKVRKLTCELHAVQTELYRELAEGDGSCREGSIFTVSPATDDLRALKTAADQLRRIMWFYFEAFHEQTNADVPAQTVPSQGMPSARESLMPQPQPQPGPLEPGSFFERLNLVIDGYMQHRGLEGKRKVKQT